MALCVRPGIEFFAITFALFKMGAVPVLIDPGIGLRNFGRCVSQAEPSAFIGIPLVHLLRRVLGWAKKTNRVNITTGRFGGISLTRVEGLAPQGAAIDGNCDNGEGTAAILFTSGSTGPAKGVVYTHANFDAQIRALRETYGIERGRDGSGDVSVIWTFWAGAGHDDGDSGYGFHAARFCGAAEYY